MPTFQEFVAFFSDRYGIPYDEIIKKDTFGMIGLDSLSLFSLLDDLEEKYNIKIDTEDITEIDTVKKCTAI